MVIGIFYGFSLMFLRDKNAKTDTKAGSKVQPASRKNRCDSVFELLFKLIPLWYDMQINIPYLREVRL